MDIKPVVEKYRCIHISYEANNLKVITTTFNFESLLGTLSNEDGNAIGLEKLHFWFALYFFILVIRVMFSSP